MIAGLIVTTVITAVMLIGWNRVLAFEAERLEQRLCMEAKRIATQPIPSEEVAKLVDDVLRKLLLNSTQQVMLRFEARTESESFQSANWLGELGQDNAMWRTLSTDSGIDGSAAGICALASSALRDKPWRIARYTHAQGQGLLAVDLIATQTEIQSALKQALEMVVPLALIFTALGAWLLSALTMRPVNRLRGAMQVVTQKALHQRLPSHGEDREFKVLIHVYNTMLSRLEISFQQASRFSADAAHELKTPLTILQGRIEQSLHQTHDPVMQQELSILLDEVGRLSDITRKLLMLSQADAGYLALQHTTIHLSQMLSDMAADTQMLLTDQTLQCAIGLELVIEGDVLLLRQLFNNLINNAVRYCRTGGWIRVSARALPAGIEVLFSNATPMIPPEERARFFDRFYRGDASHNRRTDGNGLGLSLAREIARAHGGELLLLDGASDEVVLQLNLPLS